MASNDSRSGPQYACELPRPEEVAGFEEELSKLFDDLKPDEALVVQLRLEGYSQVEIAESLDLSERTVRRMLQRIQDHYRSMLDSEAERA